MRAVEAAAGTLEAHLVAHKVFVSLNAEQQLLLTKERACSSRSERLLVACRGLGTPPGSESESESESLITQWRRGMSQGFGASKPHQVSPSAIHKPFYPFTSAPAVRGPCPGVARSCSQAHHRTNSHRQQSTCSNWEPRKLNTIRHCRATGANLSSRI